MAKVQHPVNLHSTVEVENPICPCKGGGFELIQSKVMKVIQNRSGTWYYLSNGKTVKHERVTKVLLDGQLT